MSDSFRPDRDAERILAAIVESSDDAIIAKDLRGIVLAWNQSAERMYGYPAREMVGRSISVLIPEDRPGELEQITDRLSRGQRLEHYDTVRLTKDGRRIDVSLTISPIKDAAGLAIGASTIARDITARKSEMQRLTDSEERLRSIVEAAVDGIIVIDARGHIEAFNPAAERLFGYTLDEVLGRNVNMLMPAPYHGEHDGYMARYVTTGEARIIGFGREVTALRKDGTTFPVHLSVGEMSLGGRRKFTGILHDLTARVKIEEQLREQAALVRLGEMAAVIAHEVKNPLAAVRGAIQVIGNRMASGSREAGVITDIIARIDTLNLLVKDLLLFARPPQPHPLPVELLPILGATIELLRADEAYAAVRVTATGSARVMADAELLKIVFINLLLNGAQAMKGAGEIRADISSAGAFCTITLTDSGPGVPPEVRDRLFTPFVTTKSRGTGLGLATVRRIVEAHQGTIAVDSPSGGGARVTIQLPLADS